MIELVKQNKTIELTKPTGSGSGVDMGYINNTFCNALKGTASGEVVSISDASPVEHIVKTSVAKKNLANLTQKPFYNRLTNVVEQTRDTIKLEYTNNGLKWCNVFYELDELVEGETYTISGSWEMSNPNSQGALRVQWVSDSGAVTTVGTMMGFINKSGTSNTFTVIPKPTGATKLALLVYSVADSENSVSGDTITYSNIQIEKGAVATSYTPYINELSNVNVLAMGKNLLQGGTVSFYEYKTLIKEGDTPLKAGTYTFSTIVTDNTDTDDTRSFLYMRLEDGSEQGYVFGRGVRTSVTFTVKSPIIFFNIYASINYGKSVGDTATYENIQLELGTTATDYEPYKTPVEVKDFASYENMVITTDTIGAVVNVEYNRDINKAFAAMTTAFATMGANV